MTVMHKTLEINTQGHCDILDITSEVSKSIAGSGIDVGTVTIFITGSTAGITTIEFEPGLIADFKKMWEKVAPENIEYQHNNAWGDGNGHSHVRSSLLGTSFTVPFVNKKLSLGTWQQIVVVDFDNRPRRREIFLQLLGE